MTITGDCNLEPPIQTHQTGSKFLVKHIQAGVARSVHDKQHHSQKNFLTNMRKIHACAWFKPGKTFVVLSALENVAIALH